MKRGRIFRKVFMLVSLSFTALFLTWGSLSAATITVDAKSNIFGAGHSAPPAPGGGGAGILPPEYSFVAGPGQALTFSSVTGTKKYSSGPGDGLGPEGYDPWPYDVTFPPWDGISGIVTYSYQFLAGVFLDDIEPTDPAPSSLNFGRDRITRDFTEVHPDIAQLFFIGDGLTDSGLPQRFYVPPTATRLFLGFIDTASPDYLPGSYHDNSGSLTATLEISAVPIPNAVWLLGSGLIGLVGIRRRLQK
ncbi:MAG: VPLPA-CTERM sorting domain-containing protein [Thermodesulfobacteriota bacterium]|nr:VPLPA-CTERM sorting domain-containing protein [Thermodesulfobacteriota bacterium]